MKKGSYAVTAVSAILIAAGSHAALAAETCQELNLVSGAVRGRTTTAGGTGCVAEVEPSDNATMTYREYYFFEDGLMMIFDSVEGSEAQSTGARAYYLFPRRVLPEVRELASGRITARAASGTVFSFSPRSDRIDSATNLSFTEDPSVSMKNGGGVEITQYDGILLDAGWMLGDLAFTDPKRSSVFRDEKGSACAVANSEIFTYGAEASFRFASDPELADFLRRRCPELDVSLL